MSAIETAIKTGIDYVRNSPADKVLLTFLIVLTLGGGWYVMEKAIPYHIQLLGEVLKSERQSMDNAIKAFRDDTDKDHARTERLLQMIERADRMAVK